MGPQASEAAGDASEKELLYKLLRDATRRSDTRGLFFLLFQGCKEGADASNAMVVRHNPAKGVLEVVAKTKGSLRQSEGLFSTDREEIEEILRAEQLLVRNDPDAMFFMRSESQVVLPIPIWTDEFGWMVAEFSEPDPTRRQTEFIQKLVEQTVPLIRIRAKLESSRKEIDCLWDVKRSMVNPGELDVGELDSLLAKILQLALARTGTDTGIILMADEKTGDLVIHSQAVMGDLAYRLPKKLRRRAEGRASGIAFWVLENNRPYLSGNTDEDPNYIPFFKGVKSNLSVPISFQDRCIGVIVVESRRPNAFSLREQRVLEELSRNVTVLVRRAQLFEATRRRGQGVLIRGLSPEWEEVERRVERAAATNAIVMLRGESGTGKELVARSIHFNSSRADKPLVVVNSAAIPDQLLESTLFGHVRGAFTGATYDRVGEFERADGGTIFLDEIGDLGPPLQAKLLRVLESGEIQKIGSNDPPRKVDVRVIAATSRDLERMMNEGSFREDLYFRLHVVPIYLPALRTYRQSIPGMVRAFIREAAENHSRNVTGVTAGALEVLMEYDYPGNVRELKNAIEQAVILARGDTIDVDDLPERMVRAVNDKKISSSGGDYRSERRRVLDEFEKKYIERLLSRTRGNVSRAAALAGMNRVNMYKMIKRHMIDPASFR
ncbi:MAG: sigma-54-dependent Fis family transcriptional regulator [Deltaproteobacteria bacterium]|nr:MAG: sigma-54-dependent Fis family transcriptional regulator [Deltaproteobacteria bacterium]